MKRLIASSIILLMCITLLVVILYADPGQEPDSSIYPPAPEGYQGPWPPDGYFITTSTDSCDTCGETADPPWTDPNH